MKTLRLPKILLFVVAVLSLSLAFGVSATFKTSAEVTALTVEQVTNAETGSFSMANGASVKNDPDNNAEKSGLRYAVTLSEDQYNGLMASVENGTYDSVEFGVFILPASYNAIYAVRDYAFGENAKYNWALRNAETGEWEYAAEDGKVRITKLSGDAMIYNELLGKMAFSGTIVDVLPENMGLEMLGVGYIATTVGENTSYVFTALADEVNNVRTMAYVAQVAIDNGAENATWLQSTYIQPVIDAQTTYSYVTEYYFEDNVGNFVLDSSKNKVEAAVLGTEVTASAQEFDGYVYDENNANNVSSASVVALNNATVLKRYYERAIVLVEANATPVLNFVEMYGGTISGTATATLTAPNGRVITVEDATAVATADIPQGVYSLELKDGDTLVYIADLDIYDKDDGMVWQEISEYSVYDSEVLRGGYLKLADTYVSTVGSTDVVTFDMVKGEDSTTEVGMRFRAIHSKEYYQIMSKYYSAITFDIYNAGNAGLNIEVWDDDDGDGKNNDTDGIWQGKNVWATYSVDINYLLDNWTAINGVGTLHLGNTMQSQLFTTLYGYVDSNVVSIGNFGCVSKKVEDVVTISEVQLVETDRTPVLNLLSLDTENVLDTNVPYLATLTAQNGRIIYLDTATKINTKELPQGVYVVEVKYQGKTYLTATVDIYTATDGMIWQEISKYTANDIAQYQYGYNKTGTPTITTVNNAYAINYTLATGANEGLRIKAIHSKEYYEKMSESYDYITFDVVLPAGCNVDVFSDADGNGVDDDGDGIWYSAGTKTLQLPVSFLLDNWDRLNDLTSEISGMPNSDNGSGTGNATHSMLFNIWYLKGYTVSVIGFGSTTNLETVEVADVQLVETATTPTYNLLSLDTEGKIDTTKTYEVKLVAPNGRVIWVEDASKISTADIPQGVYTATISLNGVKLLVATVDFYTATDGMVWQEISEYSVNDSEVLEYGSLVRGNTTFNTIGDVNTLSYVSIGRTGNATNTTGIGMRVRAIHSKEYYVMMSETYEAITFGIYIQTSGGNVDVYYDSDGDGQDNFNTTWQGANKWVTYTVNINYLINNWNTITGLGVTTGSTNNSQLFTTQSSTIGKSVYNIGNFGCVAKEVTAE